LVGGVKREAVMKVSRLPRAVDLWAVARELDDSRVGLLDNSCDRYELGRWSLLGLFPRREIYAQPSRSGTTEVYEGEIGNAKLAHGHPLEALQRFVERSAAVPPGRDVLAPGHPPFTHGAIGYLGYELLHTLEPIAQVHRESGPGHLLHFVEYAVIVAVDQLDGETFVCARDDRGSVDRLLGEAVAIVDRAPNRTALAILPHGNGLRVADIEAAGFAPVVRRDEYLDLIERTREHIRAGNVFELCLTQEFDGSTDATGADLYQALRETSPVPMGAYLRHDDLEVICSSPERFLRADCSGNLETRPIKGTRPRSSDPREDARLRDELRESAKDRAENVMIVDLARNDLGRVCEYGSVAVQELCVVESYATVHHLVSTVRGRLRPGLKATDAIRAAFPGGSMTGAPKVEAMRLIGQLEASARGIYSGAIGWLGGDGAFDLNITIRTLVKQGGSVSFHSGGAITADSDPAAEYAETMVKAHAIVDALRRAEPARWRYSTAAVAEPAMPRP
jgi:aminodeoxychorismate synthase component I